MSVSLKSLMVAGITMVGMGAGSTPAAHAQGSVKVQKPFTVKLGVYSPNDGDAAFSAGFVYDFLKTKATQPVIVSAYFDYATKDSVSLFSVGPQVRVNLSKDAATSTGNAYVGGALGYYRLHAEFDFSDEGGDDFTISYNKSRFGGKVLAGYEFKAGYLAEVDYNFIQKIEGSDIGGFSFRVGYRF